VARQTRHRVLVLGAGFGGLSVARNLGDAPVDVTIVDANNFHTFQPLLYQVATAGLGADDIGYPVRGIFRRQRNVAVHMARVVGIDLGRRLVHLDPGGPQEYDSLVVAAGAVSTSFGVPGVDEHAFTLKSLDDALAVRHHVLTQFEEASSDPHQLAAGDLNVVVCGGGPTGVELAGGMVELFEHVLAKDFPHLDVRRARIVLVEAAGRVLGTFTESSSATARRVLMQRGVEVITGVGVASVDGTGVTLADGRHLPARTVVWTAGVTASPLAAMLGVELGRGGRIVVDERLGVPGHDDVYALGDIAAIRDGVLPQVAQPAIQGGRYVARRIERRLAHGDVDAPFHYHDKGSMATIGRNAAVTELANGWRLSGPIGWLAWLGLHIVYLMGFRNRASVLLGWAWNYLTYDHAARLLTGEPDPSGPPDRRDQLDA
jgi:NADH:ubiquinone reductase (H+-translocating)